MAIDFPSSPTTGQSYTANNQTWIYNGVGWASGYQNSGFVRQSFTATAGQTSFTVAGGYVSGFVDVYQNGVKLVNGTDVTISSGTTVVLASGATAGDTIDVVGLASVSLQTYLSLGGGTLTGTLNGTSASFSGTLNGTSASFSGTVADGVGTLRPLVSDTLQNTTSGTSIDFTSIPSWVKRITVMFNGVSTSGSSHWLIQIGAGSVDTTGYAASAFIISTGGYTGGNYSTGFGICVDNGTYLVSGWYTICLLGSNTWVGNGGVGSGVNATGLYTAGAGKKVLSGTLDRVRVTTVNGTDTFDAGSVNILYE